MQVDKSDTARARHMPVENVAECRIRPGRHFAAVENAVRMPILAARDDGLQREGAIPVDIVFDRALHFGERGGIPPFGT